jgi:hypothetical protein
VLRRLALVCLLVPSLARAAETPETAVLPVEITGHLDSDDYQRLHDAVAARSAGARVVGVEERAKVDPLRCGHDATCWALVGKRLGARRVLAAVLNMANLRLKVWLIDVYDAKIVGQGRRTLKSPRTSSFSTMAGHLIGDLLWNAPRLPPIKLEEEPVSRRDYDPAANLFNESPPGLAVEAVKETWTPEKRLVQPQALVGARVGVLIPQAFNSFGTTYVVEVEGGYQLPFWKRRLGFYLDVSYTEPSASGTRNDPRVLVSGGSVDWNVKIQEVGFVLGLQLRFAPAGKGGRWLVPYVGIGARMDLTATTLRERAAGGGMDAGTWHEQSTRFGAQGRVGLGVHLGPGDLVVEGRVDWTPLDHALTGQTNTSRVGVLVGYLVRL